MYEGQYGEFISGLKGLIITMLIVHVHNARPLVCISNILQKLLKIFLESWKNALIDSKGRSTQ